MMWGVSNQLQNVELSCNTFDISNLSNFVLDKNLDGNFLIRENMNAFFDLAEGALTQSFCHDVASNNLMLFLILLKLWKCRQVWEQVWASNLRSS